MWEKIQKKKNKKEEEGKEEGGKETKFQDRGDTAYEINEYVFIHLSFWMAEKLLSYPGHQILCYSICFHIPVLNSTDHVILTVEGWSSFIKVLQRIRLELCPLFLRLYFALCQNICKNISIFAQGFFFLFKNILGEL